MSDSGLYKEQIKHVLGASLVAIVIFGVALVLETIKNNLISYHLIEPDGIYFWTLKCAETVMLITDVAGLLIVVIVSTYKMIKRGLQ